MQSILVVDDDRSMREFLEILLTKEEYQVSLAASGEEACQILEKKEFDLVITDIRMKDINGIEVLKRAKEVSPETMVVMISAFATAETAVEAMREGAYDYLMKPCDIEDLVEKIREVYEVKTIRLHPVLWPRHRVEEVTCYSYQAIGPDDFLNEAVKLLSREKGEQALETLFVVDHKKKLCGTITKRDLISTAQIERPQALITWDDLEIQPDQLQVRCQDRRLRGLSRPQTVMGEVKHEFLPVAPKGTAAGLLEQKGNEAGSLDG